MKTTFTYDHYFAYDELTNVLNTLQSNHADIMKVESICVSQKGRNVYAVTLSNGNPDNKPAFYVDGNTHAGEVTGSMAAIHAIDYLATNYGVDDEITELLNDYTFYVIPRISPDGAEAYLTTPAKLRSVDRPYLTETQQPGLYNDDIDNDGTLRMMRVKTPYGAWKVSKVNPNVMVLRRPDERKGEFYNIYNEGQIKDYDGLNIQNAPTLWGFDFNRNYPFGWAGEATMSGAAAYPLYHDETRAVVDFALAHKNIGCVLTNHTSGGILIYPPGDKPFKTVTRLDQKVIYELIAMGAEETGYVPVKSYDEFVGGGAYLSGAFDDWNYCQNGIPGYTVEFWNVAEKAGIDTSWPRKMSGKESDKVAEYEKMISWISVNNPDAFKPWTKCSHPQLGEVEVGGIDMKYTIQNPPKHMLLKELEGSTRMVVRMSKGLPLLTIDSTETTKVGENTYQVDVVVANTGFMPTYLTDRAKEMKVAKTIKLTVESTAAVINEKEIDLGDLEGFSGIDTMLMRNGYMTRNHKPLMKKVTLYVTGNEGDTITVKVDSEKAGKVEKTITL